MLNKEEIKEFQKLVEKYMGVELSSAEAEEQGSRLISLFELLLKSSKETLAKGEV